MPILLLSDSKTTNRFMIESYQSTGIDAYNRAVAFRRNRLHEFRLNRGKHNGKKCCN